MSQCPGVYHIEVSKSWGKIQVSETGISCSQAQNVTRVLQKKPDHRRNTSVILLS